MNIFKQFFQSMTNPMAIADYRSQRIFKSVFYVFLLTFIVFIPVIYPAYYSYDLTRETYDEFLSGNDETIEIVDGELVAKPVASYMHDGLGFTVVIDSSSNEVDTKVVEGPYLAFLKHELELSNGSTSQSITYTELGIENVSDEEFQLAISSSSRLAFLIGAIVLYWFMVLGFVISISVFALLLRMVTRHPERPRDLTYSNYWTIAAYSTTIMAVFLAIMYSFGIQVVAQNFITWIVSFVIAFQAVKAIPCIEEDNL